MLAHVKVCGKQMAPIVNRLIHPLPTILLLYLGMLLVSWRRWMSPIADSGRELDLPRRLLEGELLYRDVHYLYPPFAPYFKAWLYGIFGLDLAVLQASGVVGSLLVVLLVWSMGRRILQPWDAMLASAAVVVFCVFKPTGNMISPYAYAALYGVVFSLATLWMSLRYAERGRRSDLFVAGVLIGLAGITKQEFAFAAVVAVTATLLNLHRARLAPLVRDLLIAALPALAISLPVYGYFFDRVGWQTLIEDCHLLYTHLPAELVFYNAQRTGLDRPFMSVLQVAGGGAVLAMVIGLIVWFSDRRGETRGRLWPGLVALGLAIAGIRYLVGSQWDGSPLRFLPVVLAAMLFVAWRRSSRDDATARLVFPLAAYSLAVLARVALRVPSGGAFGGFFLPTALLLFCCLFLKVLPERLTRWSGEAMAGDRALILARRMILLALAATAIIYGVRYHRIYSFKIETARGQFYAPRATGPALHQALDLIENRTAPGETIAVFPEGSELAFLTGRRIPFRHQILIPGLMSEEDERQAIEILRDRRVRFLFIVNRPMREFGREKFGRDFYRPLGRAIEERYTLNRVLGDSGSPQAEIGDRDFFIKVYERINAP